MIKQGLILSIDYSDTNCQICYYSMRHNRPESVMTDSGVMRYLIPTVLTYDMETSQWLTGHDALENSQVKGSMLYRNLLARTLKKNAVSLGEQSFSYLELLAIYLGKLIDMAKVQTAMRAIYNITVNVRHVTPEVKHILTEALAMVGIEPENIKFLCNTETFAYYVLGEDPGLWQTGSLLFDFSEEGFFVKLLKIAGERGRELIFVEETDLNSDFSVDGLVSSTLRRRLDEKLCGLFEDIYADNPVSSVYFAGSGFNELWFENTLEHISEKIRAFKGNNIFVKGACLSGYRRMTEQNDYPIICKDRTKVVIYTEVKFANSSKDIVLSDAAVSWHDAGIDLDLIPDNASWITFNITSALSGRTEALEFDLEEFPKRPNKATRLGIEIKYIDPDECVIKVKDKGFGDFFASEGKEISRVIKIEEYL